MVLENYCKHCGSRIHPTDPYCTTCGNKTKYDETDEVSVFTPPIYNIGFFNFEIDFSPYIETKRKDFKYDICACGYLNDINNEFCYMCGSNRVESKFSKILKNKSKPKFSIGTVLCECGAINSDENVFCEMCGKQLKKDEVSYDNYSNFNLEFNDSIFCFCGEENEKFSQFCKNCGMPLNNYGKIGDVSILCTCSKINDVTSDFCIECGTGLTKENTVIMCICGEKNSLTSKFCQNCERPLNPQRSIKTRYICSCGEILDWNCDYCPNCGKNIKRNIIRRNSINYATRKLKDAFR